MLATWGDARYAASSPDPHAELVLLPRELPEAARAAIVGNVCALACGESHTLLLDDLGNVYAFGRNRERQCGARFGEHLVNDPAPVSSLRGVFATAIGAGWSTSYAISGSGEVYAWGGLWRSLSAKPRRVDMGNGVFAHSSRTRSMIEYSYSQYLGAASQRGVGGRASEDGDSGANSLGSSPPDSDAGGPAGGRPEPPPPPEVPEEGNGASNSSHGSNSSSSTHSPESLELHGQALRVAPFGMAGGPVAVAVSGGYNFCAVVCSGGQLWTFGLNDRFQCGHGDRCVSAARWALPSVSRLAFACPLLRARRALPLLLRPRCAALLTRARAPSIPAPAPFLPSVGTAMRWTDLVSSKPSRTRASACAPSRAASSTRSRCAARGACTAGASASSARSAAASCATGRCPSG